MAFDDEIPSAPGSGVGTAAAQGAQIDDEIDASAFEGVGKLGDTMPKGTYHFRLDSFEERFAADTKDIAGQPEPNFNLQWKCQEEPYTGRVLFDTIPWVTKADSTAAAAGDQNAKSIVGKRLVRANSLMEAAGFKPQGKFGFKSFLSTNPEIKITVGQEMKKTKSGKTDGAGKPIYESTDEPVNKVVKYLSLRRPS